jgi:hypothetical protein
MVVDNSTADRLETLRESVGQVLKEQATGE